ncbi:hypothetical protein PROFUN_09674 [Planoprotostelium fungivorum]|uniref:Uncharacterized protein n=1 Tax=Planoprotostelium fungivorum TaxID=1890364 RepID=A0A2P6NGJ4_9EUKA|nr:hypothetical protein PROFUN_09674 [Planoprotostelium fungivorum]
MSSIEEIISNHGLRAEQPSNLVLELNNFYRKFFHESSPIRHADLIGWSYLLWDRSSIGFRGCEAEVHFLACRLSDLFQEPEEDGREYLISVSRWLKDSGKRWKEIEIDTKAEDCFKRSIEILNTLSASDSDPRAREIYYECLFELTHIVKSPTYAAIHRGQSMVNAARGASLFMKSCFVLACMAITAKYADAHKPICFTADNPENHLIFTMICIGLKLMNSSPKVDDVLEHIQIGDMMMLMLSIGEANEWSTPISLFEQLHHLSDGKFDDARYNEPMALITRDMGFRFCVAKTWKAASEMLKLSYQYSNHTRRSKKIDRVRLLYHLAHSTYKRQTSPGDEHYHDASDYISKCKNLIRRGDDVEEGLLSRICALGIKIQIVGGPTSRIVDLFTNQLKRKMDVEVYCTILGEFCQKHGTRQDINPLLWAIYDRCMAFPNLRFEYPARLFRVGCHCASISTISTALDKMIQRMKDIPPDDRDMRMSLIVVKSINPIHHKLMTRWKRLNDRYQSETKTSVDGSA